MTIKVPRKASGFVFITLAITLAGLLVKSSSIGAVCMALAGVYGTFVAGHQHAESLVAKTGKKDDEA
jgi:hypothetical protein